MTSANDTLLGKTDVTRRTFLQASSALAGLAAGATIFVKGASEALAAPIAVPGDALDDDAGVKVMYTTCQMCHSRCGLKCKIRNGVLIKVDGNPYNISNTEFNDGSHAARLTYSTDPSTAAIKAKRGRICGKAQSVPEMLYNPTRIRTPLKRVGPRGGGKWEAITWSQAIDEIVNSTAVGAKVIDADDDGVADYGFDGLKALRDNANFIGANGANGGAAAAAANFQGELGKMSNMVIYSPGRQPNGNNDLTDRIWQKVYGTQNFRIDHTSICETSHHVATNYQTRDNRALAQGGKNGIAPALEESLYTIFFGENPAEAGFPHQSFARKVVDALHRANPMKAVVVDPRMSKTAAIVKKNGGTWVAPKPGTDAAIALGMIAWILENVIKDAATTNDFVKYLKRLNKGAVTTWNAANPTAAETTYTDACYLVVRSSAVAGITAKKFLDASKLAAGAGAANDYVALVSGVATAVDPDGAADPGSGTLDVDGATVNVVGGTAIVDSVYTLLKKQALAGKANATDAIAYWAGIADVSTAAITQMATDFTSFGRKVCATHYRGSVQHTNGTVASMAINTLNWLVGNFDWRGGGMTDANIGRGAVAFNGAAVSPSGPRIDRTTKNHTDLPNFFANGPDLGATPTKRHWFPFALNGNFQELIPSIGSKYPYPCKALISQWNCWNYSVPAGRDVGASVCKDTSKIPLHVAIDVQLGELTVLADYVLPEGTFLENYSLPATPHANLQEGTTRIPVVGKYLIGGVYKDVADVTDFTTIPAGTEGNAVWGATPYYIPVLPDTRPHGDILLDLMIGTKGISPLNDATVGLPGVGAKGITAAKNLYTSWDFFKDLFTNFTTAAPALALTTPAALAASQVSMMLARGGRFEDGDGTDTVNTNLLKNKFGAVAAPKILHIYVEDFATKYVNSQTGASDWSGLGAYEPVKDLRGNLITDSAYPYQLITYKISWHGQGRTVVGPSLMSLMPENGVWINTTDANALGVVSGDLVRLTSATSPAAGVTGKAFVTEGIRPGVVAVSHHFGHWELGSRPYAVGGAVTPYDKRRAAGLTPNPIMRIDPSTNDVALQDPIGGSVSFYDTRVKIAKA